MSTDSTRNLNALAARLQTAQRLLADIAADLLKMRPHEDLVTSLPAVPPPAPSANLPELWFHGAIGDPERIVPLHAKGARCMRDMRSFDAASVLPLIMMYDQMGMSLALTLRWMDPANKDAPDIAPTDSEISLADRELSALASSPVVRRLAIQGRLWVQFFNEVAGGPGTVRNDIDGETDRMFNWAAETACTLRSRLPGIRICGPAITKPDVLARAPEVGEAAISAHRRALLCRAIEWSIIHADAIDLHLHCRDGADARAQIAIVREAIAAAGRRLSATVCAGELEILSFEWSPSRYEPREDRAGAAAALHDIYLATAEAGFNIAGYACFYPAYALEGDLFEWASVMYIAEDAAPGTPPIPNEPFYSALQEIGQAQKAGSITRS